MTSVVAGARAGGGGGAGGRGGGGARQGGGMITRVDSVGLSRAQLDSLSARMRIGGRGIEVLRAGPAAAEIRPTVDVGSFGLILACKPTCPRARTRDGTTMYWRFDGFPVVTNPAPSSIAARAGLRDGDVLISVNGISPQVEEGALLLNRGDRELQLEIRRGEKVEKITLKM